MVAVSSLGRMGSESTAIPPVHQPADFTGHRFEPRWRRLAGLSQMVIQSQRPGARGAETFSVNVTRFTPEQREMCNHHAQSSPRNAGDAAASQHATRTVPIVFTSVVDPVGGGFVDSLERPGGNTTGFTLFEYGLSGKWLELLKQIAPGVARAAVLRDAATTRTA